MYFSHYIISVFTSDHIRAAAERSWMNICNGGEEGGGSGLLEGAEYFEAPKSNYGGA